MIQDPGSNSAWRFLWIHKSTGYDISPSAVLRLLFVVNLHELPHDSTLPRKTLLCDQRSPRSQVDDPPLRPSWTWLDGSNILHIKSLYTLVLVLLLTNWLRMTCFIPGSGWNGSSQETRSLCGGGEPPVLHWFARHVRHLGQVGEGGGFGQAVPRVLWVLRHHCLSLWHRLCR